MSEKNLESKISYLQMIQSSIDRMSTTSAIFKGFSATIITGISAVSFTEINKWVLFLAVLPIVCFLALDVYYLQLEKRYRILYNEVISGRHKIDFNLAPPKIETTWDMLSTIWKSLKSPSIYLFYGPTIIIAGIIVIMKFAGGI